MQLQNAMKTFRRSRVSWFARTTDKIKAVNTYGVWSGWGHGWGKSSAGSGCPDRLLGSSSGSRSATRDERREYKKCYIGS